MAAALTSLPASFLLSNDVAMSFINNQPGRANVLAVPLLSVRFSGIGFHWHIKMLLGLVRPGSGERKKSAGLLPPSTS
ncbi:MULTISPECIES: hypothetical protein [Serratia]|uniref:hypothetical protein n=1 Tax=Serratia TaxID=613 RepID=UPI001C0FAD05|nr:hypothetical protein [Serratia ureilytica]MBU5413935.1 hypothetical protein [Serratia ureilytica]